MSPKYQITIPRNIRNLCHTGWFSLTTDGKVITLRPVEIQEAKSETEVFDDMCKQSGYAPPSDF